MRNFQGIVFIRTQTYREIFKSALVLSFKNHTNLMQKVVTISQFTR